MMFACIIWCGCTFTIVDNVEPKDRAVLVDAILIVDLDNSDDGRRESFSKAMSRRGWWTLPDTEDGFRIGIRDASDDEQIVQMCERDVRDSAYVAGVETFDATCLIVPDDDSETAGEGELSDSGSRLDLGDLLY